MSRFVKSMEKLSPALRENVIKQRERMSLPTHSPRRYIPKAERKHDLKERGIAKGDYVYITKGQYKGTLTRVYDYEESLGSFTTHDALKQVIVPREFWADGQTSPLIRAPEPIPQEHVKLAAREVDDKGSIKHFVVDEVVYKGEYYDDRYKKWMPRRFVKHHEHIEVPWPTPDNDYVDSGRAAKESEAHYKTFELQTIAKPLIPQGVLNELRNPYSKHKKKILSDVEARRLNEPTMPLTPEQKIYLAKKAKEPKKELEPLSEEVKEFIGQRMAEHLSRIENPNLLAHLEALSKVQIPDFKKTMQKIEENQRAEENQREQQ